MTVFKCFTKIALRKKAIILLYSIIYLSITLFIGRTAPSDEELLPN